MIRRPPRSTQSRSSAASDVYKRQILVSAFLFRRIAMNVKRFSGVEMKHISHVDANIALTIILILMVTLLGMNSFYILETTSAGHEVIGIYPIASIIAGWFSGMSG